ncbi:hypothetical protein PMIT1342_00323 [Prochlorococcus marinus str. MIT 1342]|uniref:hypothetical protein n=1 Tax=Prochlorococcus TaxID=1218 RepID=UPI0007BB888A|nr:hypothetical protein [Prochlorococcus marinus]KZR83531.1 hypothetical protein PMIT1342_00323 [Prochlorococcus marinus str. MIT 1342]
MCLQAFRLHWAEQGAERSPRLTDVTQISNKAVKPQSHLPIKSVAQQTVENPRRTVESSRRKAPPDD